MSKVYKIKDKLVVYIPFDVISSLGIKEGDEVDFLKRGGYFLFAKESDIAEMLAGAPARPVVQKAAAPSAAPSDKELAVLRKLDTIRYASRTRDKVNSLLSPDERRVLQELVKKKFVSVFKKSGEAEFKYGIAKSIYDNFLFGKRAGAAGAQQAAAQPAQREAPQPKKWEQKLDERSSYLRLLESKGYLVIPTEAEAHIASASLEESIKRGLVLGTRAFNKKFYVATREFVGRSLPKINKVLGQKERGANVSDISKETGIDEDGIRSVLYIMAESGDVTEVRRDVFRVA